MQQLLTFDGVGTVKTDWADWPGGLFQLELAGVWGGATVVAQRTFADVEGQDDPPAPATLEMASLTANGCTDEVLRGRGGKVRVKKTGGSASTAIRGLAGLSALPQAAGGRVARPMPTT